jgi:GDP/UDP-N,N'-diacetylbacillosamine 2-epimerase (hydrolysing)
MGLISFSEALVRLDPEVLIVLGDRYEALAATLTAMITKIPVAHIHGGESTFGLIDEGIRHSITKMAYYHFTSTEPYRNRVVQLGEHPDRVFNVGALGIDNIKNLFLLDRQELERLIGFKFGQACMLITYHPVTLEKETAVEQFREILNALDVFSDVKKIFTKSNADAGGREINKMIDSYVRNKNDAVAFHSLGQTKYLNVLRYMKCVVGNSSSGIIEAPSMKVPTVNIGDRQAGRIRSESVIDCIEKKEKIVQAIETVISKEFQQKIRKMLNPYEKNDTVGLIVEKLKSLPAPQNLKKVFFDIPLSR